MVKALPVMFAATLVAATITQATNAGAQEPLALELFAQLSTFSRPVLSPDGRRIAGLVAIDGRHALTVMAADPTQEDEPLVVPFNDAELNWVRWASDSRLIASASFPGKRNGVEVDETRLVGINPDGKKFKVFLVADRDANWTPQIQDRVISSLAEDPKHVLVSVDYDRPGERGVVRLNVMNGLSKRVAKPRRFIQHWLADQDGVVRLGYGSDVEGMRGHIVARKAKGAAFRSVEETFAPAALDCDDPSRILVWSDHETGKTGMYAYDVDDNAIVARLFLHERFDAQSLVEHPRTGCVIGIRYIDDTVVTVYFEEPYRSLQARLAEHFPGLNVLLRSSSYDGRSWLVHVSGAARPTEYYLLDSEGFRLRLWAETYSDLDPNRLAPTEAVYYKATDGTEIPAYLTYPSSGKRTHLPAIVFPHGGPAVRELLSFDFVTQFLASRGYVVLKPNFRGSAGFGADFSPGSVTAWGPTALGDVEAGARWLIEKGIADPSRLCIVGASYGGYAALMGAILAPDLYRCVVSLSGVTDPVAMLRYDELGYFGGKMQTEEVLGDRTMKQLREYSPFHNVQRIQVPVLLLHGEEDRNVRFRQSRVMAGALEKAGKDVRFVPLQGDSHYLQRTESRVTFLRELEAFLSRHLR